MASTNDTIKSLQEKLEVRDAELQEKNAQIERLQSQVEHFTCVLESYKYDEADHREKVESMEKELKDARAQMWKMSDAKDEWAEKMSDAKDRMAGEIEKLKQALVERDQKIESMASFPPFSDAAIRSLHEKCAAAEAMVKTQGATLTANARQIGLLKNQVDHQTHLIEHNRDEQDEYFQKNNILEQELKEVYEELTKKNRRIAELEAELKEKTEEVEESKKKIMQTLSDKYDETMDLKIDVKEARDAAREAKMLRSSEVAEKTRQIELFRYQVDQLAAAIRQYKSNESVSHEKMQKVQLELMEAKEDIKVLEESKVEMAKENNDLKYTVDEKIKIIDLLTHEKNEEKDRQNGILKALEDHHAHAIQHYKRIEQDNIDNFRVLRTELAEAKEEVKKLKDANTPLTESHSETGYQLEGANREKKQLDDEIAVRGVAKNERIVELLEKKQRLETLKKQRAESAMKRMEKTEEVQESKKKIMQTLSDKYDETMDLKIDVKEARDAAREAQRLQSSEVAEKSRQIELFRCQVDQQAAAIQQYKRNESVSHEKMQKVQLELTEAKEDIKVLEESKIEMAKENNDLKYTVDEKIKIIDILTHEKNEEKDRQNGILKALEDHHTDAIQHYKRIEQDNIDNFCVLRMELAEAKEEVKKLKEANTRLTESHSETGHQLEGANREIKQLDDEMQKVEKNKKFVQRLEQFQHLKKLKAEFDMKRMEKVKDGKDQEIKELKESNTQMTDSHSETGYQLEGANRDDEMARLRGEKNKKTVQWLEQLQPMEPNVKAGVDLILNSAYSNSFILLEKQRAELLETVRKLKAAELAMKKMEEFKDGKDEEIEELTESNAQMTEDLAQLESQLEGANKEILELMEKLETQATEADDELAVQKMLAISYNESIESLEKERAEHLETIDKLKEELIIRKVLGTKDPGMVQEKLKEQLKMKGQEIGRLHLEVGKLYMKNQSTEAKLEEITGRVLKLNVAEKVLY